MPVLDLFITFAPKLFIVQLFLFVYNPVIVDWLMAAVFPLHYSFVCRVSLPCSLAGTWLVSPIRVITLLCFVCRVSLLCSLAGTWLVSPIPAAGRRWSTSSRSSCSASSRDASSSSFHFMMLRFFRVVLQFSLTLAFIQSEEKYDGNTVNRRNSVEKSAMQLGNPRDIIL